MTIPTNRHSFRLACLFATLLIALPCLAQEKEEQAAPAAEQDKPKPLGDTHNPVKCDGPRGERYYLSRLVDPDG
ncbi:MAG: hypothetical protein AAF085_17155, partial [Planctomycetota bacterium]